MSLDVIVLLSVVAVCRMCWRVVGCCFMICFASWMVWFRAVFESEIMMHGWPAGSISCAMVMAISSAVLLQIVVVPYPCGSAWMRVIRGWLCCFSSCVLVGFLLL